MANSVRVRDFVGYFREIENIGCGDDELLLVRGVSDASFCLKPGIVFDKRAAEDEAYHSLILEYPEEFNTKDHLGTLAKMQHYGLNTRLLDVSDNILTALFFASEQRPQKDGKVMVFKVKKSEVLHHNSDRALMLACLPPLSKKVKDSVKIFCENHNGVINDSMIKGHPEMVKLLHEIRGEYPAFETAIVGQDLLDTFFVQINKNNQRMKVQSGYFAIFGLDEEAGRRKLEKYMQKEIIIDGSSKKRILDQLKLMRVHSDTVYPDLERTALYLRGQKLAWKLSEE